MLQGQNSSKTETSKGFYAIPMNSIGNYGAIEEQIQPVFDKNP